MTLIVLPLIESDPDFAAEFAKTFDNPDIKENFRRKARYVAGGHQTDTPKTMTYSSVVSRDSVRIALVAAALNDLNILVCDIEGAYLTAKCREKIWITAGVEFGSEAGTTMIVKMALYMD